MAPLLQGLTYDSELTFDVPAGHAHRQVDGQ